MRTTGDRLVRCAVARVGAAALVMATVAVAGAGATPAAAATAAPGWAIKAVAKPTQFSSAETPECKSNQRCDKYDVLVTNVGGAASEGTIEIIDTLPATGVAVATLVKPIRARDLRRSKGEEEEAENKIECSSAGLTVTCTYAEPLPPGETLAIAILVEAAASSGPVPLEDRAEVKGGGALAPASTAVNNDANNPVPPSFELVSFGMGVYGPDGKVEGQAGGRPETVTSSYQLATALNPASSIDSFLPIEDPKTLTVELPLGLIGDPQTTETCPEALLGRKPEVSVPGFSSLCPSDSRIGTVVTASETESGETPAYTSSQANQAGSISGLYNMTPEAGYPAVFGFRFIATPVLLYTRVVPTSQGYRLLVTAPNLPHGAGAFKVLGVLLTFFGRPAVKDGITQASPQAFFRNPTSCVSTLEELSSRMEANSWVDPGHPVTAEVSVYPDGITGCDMLQFNPELQVQPETTQADTPSGYEVTLKAPQPQLFSERATPDLKYASVSLPAGVALSPSAATGLEGCSEAQIDPEGVELGEGHPGGNGSPYDDGVTHASPGHCPGASQIGEVEVKTPLLPDPLKGHVYLAQPQCGGEGQEACKPEDASNGRLYGIYLEIAGSGVILKLKGKVSVNPGTGQITTTFSENPQLPFEELKLTLDGGQRAPLANPQTCGTATTTSVLEPWSAPQSGANATPSWPFAVTGCASPMGFSPGFLAGTEQTLAGGFSPFELTLTRHDGEQDLGGISLTLPPGVAGMISQVPLCGEAQANAGTCPEASRIGTATVAAGAGSQPLWVSGRVYLTGPYGGAPFGLSVVVPAKAGPFNLGNEVVRSAISVDPHTAQVTIASEPLRLIRDGIPFRLKTINVTIDRPGFTFNPTNCAQLHVAGSIAGDMPDGSSGSTVPVSSPFAVAGCRNLPFKPRFTVLTQARTSKANGAYLHVKVVSGPGQANIGKVKVDLPKQLPSRLTTLQKACTAAVFGANPASCPTGSVVGTATAVTPVLKSPLTGPAYLVSHGGAAFPDLEIMLQGEGITLLLDGNTDIKKGITSSSFNSVPDAPISTFDLVLPEGPHSALAAHGNLCKTKLNMPTKITGQNGAVIKQTTKIAVTGCPKHNAKKRTSKAKRHHKRRK